MTIVEAAKSWLAELGGDTSALKSNATIVDVLKAVLGVLGGDISTIGSDATSADLLFAIGQVMGLGDTDLVPYSQETIFDYDTADLQSDLDISNGKITGTLKWLDDGQLVSAHGEGNFIAIEFDNKPSDVTSVKMGMFPTYKNGEFVYDDSGLQEVGNDPDKGGAFKVTDKNIQVIKLVTSDGSKVHTQLFDLTALNCLPAED